MLLCRVCRTALSLIECASLLIGCAQHGSWVPARPAAEHGACCPRGFNSVTAAAARPAGGEGASCMHLMRSEGQTGAQYLLLRL